ncbi:MAG: hypothetical protein KJ600_06100 [Nanoarchaeota archaeon]|nr:hypothetical protein [Nanoarchaeota archaeon]MBU1104099.1 hypothetical protein [Nanoarchaeota archaeon]
MKSEKVVFFDEDLEKAFENLSEADPLKKALKKAVKDIGTNVFCGRNVKKKLIPKEFIQKYSINNLWIYNLPSAWRLLYAITPSEEAKIIAAILDWMSHKDYERLFRF